MHLRRSRWLGVTALAVAAVATVLFMVGAIGETTNQKETREPVTVVESGAASQQVDPCAHLGESLHISADTMSVLDLPVADHVARSTDVAKTTIASIGTTRFDTPSGGPPTPLSPTADEDQVALYSERVLSAVVLNVTTQYKGSSVTGYVVMRSGGTSAFCPDYTYEIDPQPITGAVGDTVMALLVDVDSDIAAYNPPWLQYLTAVAAQLSVGGATYVVKMPANWYLYQGSAATSASSSAPIAVAQLELEIEEATEN